MVCKRRKAFIGTAISLGASIVGGIVGNQKKKRAEEAQLQYQADINQAKSATSVAQNMTNARSNDYSNSLENRRLYTSSLFKKGGEIYIKPSKRGTFTEAAKKRGQSVQGFASKVLANKDNYSSTMVKKANFARNAAKWKHLLGGVSNLFKYGGSSRFSKRATKQNLGLENVNKTGQNAPTAYRKPSVRSSTSSLTSLRSTDKVVQKALDSIISSSPVKELDDNRTTYRNGGTSKIRNNNYIAKTDAIDSSKPEILSKDVQNRRIKEANASLKRTEGTLKAVGSVINAIDPTGISNIPDLINSIRNDEGTISIGANILGSIPGIGKVGKIAGKLAIRRSLKPKARSFISDIALHGNKDKYKKVAEDLSTDATRFLKENNSIGAKSASKQSSDIFNSYDRIDKGIIPKIETTQETIRKIVNTPDFIEGVTKIKDNYRKGGSTDINPIIQQGGDSIRLKPNTFLLRGRKHANGGIIIGKGNNSIEAEGGEVVKIDNNVMKILSTVPMANGESPASRVIKGENPDKVFDSQEKFKDMNNLNNKQYGIKRRRAALGDWLNVAGDAFSMISPLIGGRRTKRAINRMIAPSQPQQLQTANLRTTYNISPQLTESRQAEREAIAETSANTASSVASQARNMRIRNLGLGQRNQLLGQKENIETQLMNQAALNRQQVTNQNISATNDWRDRVGQFVNDQIVSSANVDNQMIEGVTSGIRDIQSRFDKNKQERNALTAIMASNPEQVELFMKKRKEYENLLDRNSGSLLRPYYLGGLKNKRKAKVR